MAETKIDWLCIEVESQRQAAEEAYQDYFKEKPHGFMCGWWGGRVDAMTWVLEYLDEQPELDGRVWSAIPKADKAQIPAEGREGEKEK